MDNEIFALGQNTKASSIDIKNILLKPKPGQIRDEIPTLNEYGYMKFEFEEYSKKFVDVSKESKLPVLEIGAAYGWVVHKCLDAGARVVAVDASGDHLLHLIKDADQSKIDNLEIQQAYFPKEVNFEPETFGAILMARVLHFLTPDEIEIGLAKIHNWLSKEGYFIVTNCSIYHSCVKAKMGEEFKSRILKGDKWPGLVYNQKEVSPVHANFTKDFLHVFTLEQLVELLPKHGFFVEKIGYFDYPSDQWDDNDRGHIGFVARKI